MTTDDLFFNYQLDRHSLATVFDELNRDYLPHISTNCVIFGYDGKKLQVLLHHIDLLDEWALPCSFIRRDEAVDQAATTLLTRTTGYAGAYMRQLHVFGALNRTEPAAVANLKKMGVERQSDHWVVGRVISIGYLALVDLARMQMPSGSKANSMQWWDIASRPRMTLDHDAMIEKALAALRAQLDALPLGTTLLPNTFTMSELQGLYEAVHGISLDRRNFQKRMLQLGLIARTAEQRSSGPHRPAYLYSWVGSSNSVDQIAASAVAALGADNDSNNAADSADKQ